jgi:ABC-type branched-subunit amino acid transport system substrate-binding protein
VKEQAKPAGIEFVYDETFPAATTDFRPAIAAAMKTSPDLYFIEGFEPALSTVGRQLREAGVRNMATVVAFSVSKDPSVFEGGWYTDSYVSPQFKSRLDRRYPSTRLATHMMPYAYDSFRMLVQAFESGQDVVRYIRAMTTYDGTAGVMTKIAGSGNFRSAPAVWVIRDGKPALEN